ncbi:MAG: T9SS type A sorting domain-containing protein [Flavobacteriales bacterium]
MSKSLKSCFLKAALICSLLLQSVLSFSQSATADCAIGTGTGLTAGVSASVNSAQTLGSPTVTLCGTGTAQRDVWYWFTATSSTTQVAFTPGGNRDAAILVYGACGTATVLGCANSFGAANTTESLIVNTTVGSQYGIRLIRVGATTPIQGTLVFRPGNNDCANSTIISASPDATCTAVSGNSIGATQSSGGCTGTADDDVWYQFQATATSHQVTVTPGTMSNVVFQVYSGSCGSLTSLFCVNNTTGANAEVQNVAGLTIGSTYFVRVHSQGNGSGQGTFTICVNSIAPANDECANATSVIASATSSCTSVSGTTVNATQSLAGCTGTADDDVWFSFQAVNTTQLITVTPSTLLNPVFEVFSGTCGSLTSMGCVNNSGSNNGTESQNISGLTIGTSYFVRVYSQVNTSGKGTFDICISNTIPLNDDCGGAILLTASSTETCGVAYGSTSAGATASMGACVGSNSKDVWFKFVATHNTQLITVLENTLGDAVVELFSGSCGSLTSLGCTDNDSGDAEYAYYENLVVGNTYYCRVYDYWNFIHGTFTICVTVPVSPCANPVTLDPCSNQTTVTLDSHGIWAAYNGVAWKVRGEEKVYSFTPASSGDYVIDVTNIVDDYFVDFLYRNASSCAYAGWTYIDDFDAVAVSPSFALTAGTEYFILIDDENMNLSTVTFKVRKADNTPCPAVVSFANNRSEFEEIDGNVMIDLTIENPLSTAMNLSLTLVSGDASRVNGFSTQVITIPANATTFQVPIQITNNGNCDDHASLQFAFSNLGLNMEAGVIAQHVFYIQDDEIVYENKVDQNFEVATTGFNLASSITNPWVVSNTSPINGTAQFVSGNTAGSGSNYFTTDAKRTYFDGMTSVWKFQVNHFGNEPDQNTKWQFILASDKSDLWNVALNGYAVGINPLTSPDLDLVTLWKIVNGQYFPIVTSSVDVGTANTTMGFEVTRDETGLWTLKFDANGGFDGLVQLGTGTDLTYNRAGYMGMRYLYAAGNSHKLSVDDVLFYQKGCPETIYSVGSGNVSGAVWATTSTGAASVQYVGRLSNLVIQSGHSISCDKTLVCGDLTVNTGGTLNTQAQDVVIHNDLINNGALSATMGRIIFNGNEAQTWSGSASNNVKNVEVYNSLPLASGTALTLLSNVSLIGVLSPEKGKINVNNKLTLISNATTTGSIGEIKNEASVIGSITAQRYLPTALSNYVNLGNPIVGQTLSDWNDDLTTTGFPGSDYPSYNFNNIYWYDESVTGDRNQGWIGATNITNTLASNKGYMVYMTGTANTVDATGEFQKGDVSMPVPLTNTGSSGDGWNLLLNPYPSEIDWDLVVANSPGVSTYYVYDSQTGAYKSYNGLTHTGTASRYIPMGQSFFIGANVQGVNLNFKEFMKSNNGTAFERSENLPEGWVLQLAKDGFESNLMLTEDIEATAAFNADQDAFLLKSPEERMHHIYSVSSDQEKLTMDVRNAWGDEVIPIYADVVMPGIYAFEIAQLPASLVGEWMVKDVVTESMYEVTTGLIIQTKFDDSFNGIRWVLMPKQAQAESTTSAITISSAVNGWLVDCGTQELDLVTITIYSMSGQLVQETTANLNGSRYYTIPNDKLSNGSYLIEIRKNDTLWVSSKGLITR